LFFSIPLFGKIFFLFFLKIFFLPPPPPPPNNWHFMPFYAKIISKEYFGCQSLDTCFQCGQLGKKWSKKFVKKDRKIRQKDRKIRQKDRKIRQKTEKFVKMNLEK
jgi:hypothetical protein